MALGKAGNFHRNKKHLMEEPVLKDTAESHVIGANLKIILLSGIIKIFTI
jgi:hypothetical protein